MSRVKRRKPLGPSIDDEYHIWQFVYENLCETNLYEDADESLFRQYLQENPDKKWTIAELMEYFTNSMLATLYKCDLPPQTVLQLYKKLDLEISPHVEMLLESKFNATLRIDADRCLHSYTMISVAAATSPQKRVAPSAKSPPPPETPEDVRRRKQPIYTVPHDMQVSEAFDRKMWQHIFVNYDRLNMRMLMSTEFWQEMIDSEPEMPLQSAKLLMHHYCSRMLEKLYMQSVAVEKRLGIYKMMELPITRDAEEWFQKKDRMRVQLNFLGCVESWEEEPQDRKPEVPILRNIATWEPRNNAAQNAPSTSTSNSAPPPRWSPRRRAPSPEEMAANVDPEDRFQDAQRESSRPESRAESYFGASGIKRRVQFTEQDQLNVWNYVYKKFRNAHTVENPVLPKGLAFWNEYVRKTNSSKTAVNWSSHFRKRMCPTLYEMRLPREKILYLYQNIEINISDHVRKILERKCQAKLRLGQNGQLISWKYLDEQLDEASDQEDEQEEAVEEDPDTTVPETDSDNELNLAIEESSDNEKEQPRTPTTPKTPRTPRTRSSTRNRRSLRGDPIPTMPDLSICVDEEEEEEVDEMAPSPPRRKRAERAEDTANREKTLRTAIALKQQDLAEREERMRTPEALTSTMTLRKRPEVSPSKKTPTKKTPENVPEGHSERVEDLEEHEERMRTPEASTSTVTLRKRPLVSPSKKTPTKKSPIKMTPGKIPEDRSQGVPVSEHAESLEPFVESNEAEAGASSGEEDEEEGQLMRELMEANEGEHDEYITLPTLMDIIKKIMEETDDDNIISEINAVIDTSFRKENWDKEGVLVSALYNKVTTIIRANTSGDVQAAFLKRTDGWLRKVLTNIPNRTVFDMIAKRICANLKKELKKTAENEDEPCTSSKLN